MQIWQKGWALFFCIWICEYHTLAVHGAHICQQRHQQRWDTRFLKSIFFFNTGCKCSISWNKHTFPNASDTKYAIPVKKPKYQLHKLNEKPKYANIDLCFFVTKKFVVASICTFWRTFYSPRKCVCVQKMTNMGYVARGPAQWVAEVLSFLFDEQLFRARRVHAIKWLFEQLMNILTNWFPIHFHKDFYPVPLHSLWNVLVLNSFYPKSPPLLFCHHGCLTW